MASKLVTGWAHMRTNRSPSTSRDAFHIATQERLGEPAEVGEVPALRAVLGPQQVHMVLDGIEHEQPMLVEHA